MEDLVQYIVTTLGDQTQGSGELAHALARYSRLTGAERYYSPLARGRYWFSEATAVSTLYGKIRDWADKNAPNFLVLAQQHPTIETNEEAHDILIVDTDAMPPKHLGIELQATFNLEDTENDLCRLRTFLNRGTIDYGVAIFCADEWEVAAWLSILRGLTDDLVDRLRLAGIGKY